MIIILIIFIMINISCVSTDNGNLHKIDSPYVFTINAPVAGNYPQSLYKYPFRQNSTKRETYTQTIEWLPAVEKTFAVNTTYTASITLTPENKNDTFTGTLLSDITGLPKENVEETTIENQNRNLIIKIVFEKTASETSPSKIIFSDEFDGDSLDNTKWEFCPEWERQGRSSWRNDMVSVSDGMLRLKLIRDKELGSRLSNNKKYAENWIRAGAVRSLKIDTYPIYENGYGYYESRIKFPVVSGTWGAFWLMTRTQNDNTYNGMYATEIDIVETISNDRGLYNSAMHWDGYGKKHKGLGSDDNIPHPVNIYDGEFHIFSLDWSPSEYIFYVDYKEFFRVDGRSNSSNLKINQNLNYVKLSVEGADWAGPLPEGFTQAEMLVDYVRVYNQPKR